VDIVTGFSPFFRCQCFGTTAWLTVSVVGVRYWLGEFESFVLSLAFSR
jgi:hypothetical protein